MTMNIHYCEACGHIHVHSARSRGRTIHNKFYCRHCGAEMYTKKELRRMRKNKGGEKR